MADLEQNNTSILTTHMHHVLKPGYAYQFAIDFTNDPYYGSTDEENEAYIVRSKRKKSTNERIAINSSLPSDTRSRLPSSPRCSAVSFLNPCI
ncbi:hypothetical protein [Methanofollis tationis]|uniref:Uncharacterized protein n=1 Tax=Methanofollis tationis TaxID=81417 RepID=A0A7K4HPM1_9EURY|nr:hypothetical protein [Methanofollis tationis]NVO67224.1 hypothetical protein [Methanofollis tationis]